jgi:carbamoyl-phosphate synthase large subunit
LHLIINIPKSRSADTDSNYQIRRSAIDFNVPLITNARLASAFIHAFCRMRVDDIAVKTWKEY